MPSESTIRRTLQRLDADGLDGILHEWLAEPASETHPAPAPPPGDRDAVAVDGKTLRGSGHGSAQRPRHLLAALDHRTGQTVGQIGIGQKTNEIPKLPDLLKPLDLTNVVVTIDALHEPGGDRHLARGRKGRPLCDGSEEKPTESV